MRLLGYQSDHTVAELLSGARLLVFPSLYEGFGLPVLEAMASGIPVVAARASGNECLVTDGATGALVTPGLVLIKVHADTVQYWDGEDNGTIRL